MWPSARLLIALSSSLLVGTACLASPIIQGVQGGRLSGISRPEVVVKTGATTPATPPATNVGIITTFDTGADHFLLRPANLATLGLANNANITPDIGGASNYKSNSIVEDSLTTFADLNLNAGQTGLASGVQAGVKVVQHAPFDALGSDYMINGMIAIYNPQGQPVKTVNNIGTTGSLQFLPALVGGATNPQIAATFNPAFTLDTLLTSYNGFDPRPTVTGSMKDSTGHTVAGAKALWDTGAPTSQISSALIGTGPGQLDLKLSTDGTRAIIPEVRFVSGDHTLIINNLQVTVAARSADVPLRIGTNVLDQFKMLIDLHNDPNIAGNDQSFGLERQITAYNRQIATGTNKVDSIGPQGSSVTVNWTDASGGYLLDTNSLPIQETKVIPTLPSGTTATTSFNVIKNAVDFVETIVSPAGAAGTIRIEAARARAAAAAAAKEAGQTEPVTGAGRDIVDIWDDLMTRGILGLTLPVLFADNGPELFSAVDLSEFIAGISPGDYQRLWVGDPFEIINGRAFRSDHSMLPGFYFGFNPLEVNLLAADGEPLFLNSSPVGVDGTFFATALAQIGLVPDVPEPGLLGLFILGLAIIGLRFRRASNSRQVLP